MYSAFPGNCSVSYLSFVNGMSLHGRSLNGGEIFLHWKADMLPLFSTRLPVTRWVKLSFNFELLVPK